MKVFILVRSLDVGGTERQVVLLARNLAARGHQIALAQLYSGGAMGALLENFNVRLISVGKTARWDVLGPLSRLRRLLRSEDPDVIYSFLPMQNVLAALLRPRSSRARLVFGVRASGMQLEHYDRLSDLSYRAEAILSNRADLIVANAAAFCNEVAARGFRADRISVIPNGIDTSIMTIDPAARNRIRRAWNVDSETFLVGMVARLDPMKDHPSFLAAAADFAKLHSDAKFVCVGGGGTGSYIKRLQQIAIDLGIERRILFTGEAMEMSAVYNAFDIATLSSAFGEGFPNVIGEAMACGVPVVATDVGDARAIVGELGVIVPPRYPALLSRAWDNLRRRLVNDPELRFMVRNRISENYSIEAMVCSTERVLARVLAG